MNFAGLKSAKSFIVALHIIFHDLYINDCYFARVKVVVKKVESCLKAGKLLLPHCHG